MEDGSRPSGGGLQDKSSNRPALIGHKLSGGERSGRRREVLVRCVPGMQTNVNGIFAPPIAMVFYIEEQSMKRREFLALTLVSLGALSSLGQTQSPAARIRCNFNSGWRALVGDPHGAERPEFDDSQWKQVTTPYAWNEDAAFRVSIHDLD